MNMIHHIAIICSDRDASGIARAALDRGSEDNITVLRITSIKDGQITAEFDTDALPAGLRPAVGDRVFRLKPLGN